MKRVADPAKRLKEEFAPFFPDADFDVIALKYGPRPLLLCGLFVPAKLYLLGMSGSKAVISESRFPYEKFIRTIWEGAPADISITNTPWLWHLRTNGLALRLFVPKRVFGVNAQPADILRKRIPNVFEI